MHATRTSQTTEPASLKAAFKRGQAAMQDGWRLERNPYDKRTDPAEWEEWRRGWKSVLSEMPPPEGNG